jgi:hypothetical protein
VITKRLFSLKINVLLFTLEQVMDGILSLIEGEDPSKPAAMVHVVQAWLTPVRPAFSFIGRYVPEHEFQAAELDGKLSIAGKKDFEDWLRESTTLVVNTEINVQLGEFTIKKNAVQPLPQYMMQDDDFISVFRRVTTDDVIQCADVKNTTNRKWVRLVGLGYDLQLWAPDTRRPTIPMKNSYENCSATWVKDIFDPWKNMVLPDVELYFLSDAVLGQTFIQDLEVITMCGYSENLPPAGTEKGRRDSKQDSNPPVTLKEVVVYRYPRVFHIFNVVEYGRRWYRQLIFSSEPDLSLHEMKMSRQELNQTILECSGDSSKMIDSALSLVISKDALEEGSGKLTYIPSRLLSGLMPSSLLNQYNFWQHEDDSLTGYMPVLESNKSVTRSMLKVQLRKIGGSDMEGFCNAVADAHISRIVIADGNPSQTDNEKEFDSRPDTSKPIEYLVNLMSVLSQYVKKYNNNGDSVGPVSRIKELVDFDGETATLHALVRLVLRLDCLANVLAWSKSDPSQPNATISIDTIELPRLRLTFEKKVSTAGIVQYVCVEQTGMFLTGYDDSLRFADLLQGLPRAVLLSNADNEYFVLLPAIAKPVLTRALGSGPATYNMVMSMTNKVWLANTGEAAYFTYPIHSSGCFMSSRSIASSLYLLVLRLMSRDYRDAFRLIESCVCDSVLTPQEKQIYDVIGTIKDDFHPDVHACRLKLYFVTYGCSDVMPYQFSVESELVGYVSRIRLISSYCKLSPDEEIFLTAHVPMENQALNLTNRERLIRASFNLSFDAYSKKASDRVFTAEYPRAVDLSAESLSYAEPLDLSLLDIEKEKMSSFLKKLTFGQYTRPDPVNGPQAIALLMKFFDNNSKPGFFLLYELFTGALPIVILREDKSRDLASVLMSILNDDGVSGIQSVILRIMESHNDLSSKMPPFEDRRKLKLPKLTGLDIFQAHVKVAAGFVQSSMDELQLEKLAFKRTSPFRNPDSIQASMTLDGASDYYEGRSWLNPRITDFARPKRSVSSSAIPPQLTKIAAYYTVSEVSFFLGSPLHSIDLRNYVEQKSLANRGEAAVSSESPLRVMLHPSSNSHIARSAVNRLEQDVADFSVDENKGVLPVLKTINTTGGALVGAGLDRALSAMTSMIAALEKLRERDAAIVKSGVQELLDFANSDTPDKHGNVYAIAHSLQQKAGTEVPMVRTHSQSDCPSLNKAHT